VGLGSAPTDTGSPHGSSHEERTPV
jgi:hypothetical protein